MTWGGLRGALTLVLALAATEHAALGAANQRFIAVLATGFVMFTLFVNGTTLRPVIALLGLNRLSPRNQVLRDRVLALSYAEVSDTVRTMARDHALDDAAIRQVVAPYRAWIVAADARDAAEQLSDRDRLAIALVALANQEHVLVLETRADRIASTATVQALLRNVEALIEGARGPTAVSAIDGQPVRRCGFPSPFGSPISSTGISASFGSSPTASPTMSSCCWSRACWSTSCSPSMTGAWARSSARGSPSSPARSSAVAGNASARPSTPFAANTPTMPRRSR